MSWMTQTEAAVALGCSIRTVRRRIRSGAINARRDGRRLMVEVDTDRAMSTVTQVGRHLAEVGAAAAIQRQQDANALSTIHATFKDTLGTLARCQDRAARDLGAYRRSARWGWATAAILGIGFATGGWFIHTERVAHDDALHRMRSELQAMEHASDTAIVTTEIRHAGEMRTLSARQEGESSSLHEALAHERTTVASFEERLDSASQTLADRTTRLELALSERDRLSHDNRQAGKRLQYMLLTSKMAGSFKSFWTALRVTAGHSAGLGRAGDMQTALNQLAATHTAELASSQGTHERELRTVVGREKVYSDELRATLEENKTTLQRLEQRNTELADSLIAAVTERSYLAAAHDRLVQRIEELQKELERLKSAESMASSMRSVWSALQAGWRLPSRGEDYASHTPASP